MKKRTSIIVSALCISACQQPMIVANKPPAMYQSSISSDGTSVVVKLADGQQRVVSSGLPSYSAQIGQVTVQRGERSFTIQSTKPTLSTEGKVTGSVFKPNAPEGAHWQLITLNGQTVDSKKSKRPPYLRMVGGQMHGLTGCNVMSGIYHRDEEKMQFMRVQGTTNNCDYQELERNFIGALQRLRLWRVTPDYHLQFLDEKSQVVAEFIALFP